jgi:hypothetical protein
VLDVGCGDRLAVMFAAQHGAHDISRRGPGEGALPV